MKSHEPKTPDDSEMLEEHDFSGGRRGRYAARYSAIPDTNVASQSLVTDDHLYVERRENGDYVVRKGGAKRASAVMPTQREAIDLARTLNPDAVIHVKRIRKSRDGTRDQWRKA